MNNDLIMTIGPEKKDIRMSENFTEIKGYFHIFVSLVLGEYISSKVAVVTNSEAIVNSCYCTTASLWVDSRTGCSQLTMPLTETEFGHTCMKRYSNR
jgi:hypothetical protein